jgi:hypothetical protein
MSKPTPIVLILVGIGLGLFALRIFGVELFQYKLGASQRVVNNNIAINTTIAAANEKNTVCIM